MPETMIIYRFFFEWLSTNEGIRKAKEKLGHGLEGFSTQAWWDCYCKCKESIPPSDWNTVESFIHTNDFDKSIEGFTNPLIVKLSSYYCLHRKLVNEKGSELFIMKQEYDKKPNVEAKRHAKKK